MVSRVNLRLFLFLCLISLFLLLFDNLDLLKFPKGILQTVTLPLQYGLYQNGNWTIKQIKTLLLSRTAAQENLALKQQLGELLTENADLKKRLSETAILIDQEHNLNPQTYDLKPARVIGLGRYLLIEKGSIDGVTIGQAVVWKDNYIGQIKLISAKTSQVILAEDPDSKVAVYSQGQGGKAKGILIGLFGSKMLMDKILHQENVEAGDIVYSEGTEGILPKGLIMGKVAQVSERQNEIFKQAQVIPLFDPADLNVVFLINH